MALAIIISADFVHVPLSWRIAPITTAIVMTPAYVSHSPQAALRAALERTGDVVIGSVAAVAVSATAACLVAALARKRAQDASAIKRHSHSRLHSLPRWPPRFGAFPRVIIERAFQ